MSWNNAPPPFPPPGYQTRPPHPPPPPPPPRFAGSPADAGNGVDHTYPDHGFDFGPGSFNAWSGPFDFGGAWGPRGRGGWGFGLGPRGGRRGHGGHHGHSHSHDHHHEHGQDNDEDLYDITAAAAAAEADMEANHHQTAAAAKDGDRDAEKADSPATMAADGERDYPDPPEEVPPSFSSRRRQGCRGRGRGRGFGFGFGPGHGHGHGHGPRRGGGSAWHRMFAGAGAGAGGPPSGMGMPESVQELLRQASEAMARFSQQWRGGAPQGGEGEEDNNRDGNTFTPPVDLFETRDNWTIHVALPGAKKEDLGVNWDPARSVLIISGVVHRLGNEEFLAGLVSSERRIGMFERKITLPPVVDNDGNGPRDEVDGDNIQARMQDGILVVVIPKVEKDWTEVKKIDVL